MNRRPARSGPWLLAIVACTACTGDGAPDLAFPAADWSVVEELRIGSADDSDYALTFFRVMEAGEDGAMYTLHPMEQLIRVFNADGTLRGTIGGRGDGPGEFQNAVEMGWVADTLWVLDFNAYRFTQFAPDGEYLESFSVPFAMETGPARPVGLLPDGTLHGAPPPVSRLIHEGVLTHHTPMLMARDGVVTDTLLSIPFGRNQWTISDPEHPRRGALYTSQPFADGPLWSFVPTDRALVIVEREAPVDAGEARFSVAKVAFSGDTLFSRFYPFDAVPVQPDEADSILDAMAERFGQTGLQGTTAGRWRQWAELTFYRPDFHPGVTDLVVAKDRSIWLALGGRGTNQAVWLALDDLGEPMGSIILPADAKILLVDPPRLWTYETDDLDVPYLVRYRVDREGAAF